MTTKQLNRVTVRVTGGVSASSVRFPRAFEMVHVEKRAEWVNHPVDDPGKPPMIRILTTAATLAAAACEYDRLNRRLKVNELKRIPFAGDVDRMAGGAPKGAWAWEKAVMRNCAAEVNGTL